MQFRLETPRPIPNHNQVISTRSGTFDQPYQSQEDCGRELDSVSFTKTINHNQYGKPSWLYTTVDNATEPSPSYRASQRHLELSGSIPIYQCITPGCNKAYKSLSHLNAHIILRGHGPKRKPSEFGEFRN